MCCHFLLQGIILTQGLNTHLLHWRWILYHWATWEALLMQYLFNARIEVSLTELFLYTQLMVVILLKEYNLGKRFKKMKSRKWFCRYWPSLEGLMLELQDKNLWDLSYTKTSSFHLEFIGSLLGFSTFFLMRLIASCWRWTWEWTGAFDLITLKFSIVLGKRTYFAQQFYLSIVEINWCQK